MINSNTQKEKLVKACWIIMFIGTAYRAVSLFTFTKAGFEYKASEGWSSLLTDLLCIAGFAIVGYAILKGKTHLITIGLFASAGSFLLELFIPLSWIAEEAEYADSLYELLFGYNSLPFMLLICATGLAGFLLMGLFFHKKGQNSSSLDKAAMILLAINIVVTLIYSVVCMKQNYLDLGTFIAHYYASPNYLSIIGILGTMLLPFLYPEERPVAEQNQIGALMNDEPAPRTDVDIIETLKKYQQLLEMGIITQEEFETKKKELF